MSTAYEWLLEMGAIPMQSSEFIRCLILGDYRQGAYPIKWALVRAEKQWNSKVGRYDDICEREVWQLFGRACPPMKPVEVQRILDSIKSGKCKPYYSEVS